MTRIDFYANVPDTMRTLSQLCAKALDRGMRVLIATEGPAMTEMVDRQLWTHASTGFLPHVRAGHRLAGVTPVVLDHELNAIDRDELLINLRPEPPEVFSRFQRLVEIVSTDAAAIAAGRARYRFYRDRGYELQSHDLGKT
jgi:DNA polymerase-3 subunit chi